ncbi:helix-turn-helix domain-containing protein [Marinagarivorans cellulosilyticus]|uniref:HTH araC/xylS-type domain-containing protein n=1 Tax=Marinagarivorans cellulosilyticus TaxID=2721545 RepID=A0AAN1WEN4_9GAMM|nr:AraC family transcriptional regulator [Marinagarivorans cellulosilyticus]BCD96209.1 hypothetical protein MARGE09_P0408 [Marinagarivorans cellulosilyticus]
MKMIMFNIHDLILFAVLATCALLAALTLNKTTPCHRSRHMLVAFFAMNSLIAIDTLFFWGEGVKPVVFSVSPWLTTIFSVAVFAFGPILFGLIRYELYGRHTVNWSFALHFMPALLTPLYLYWVCHRFPLDIQRELILNLNIYSTPDSYFAVFTSLKKLVPAIYGFMCLHLAFKAYSAFTPTTAASAANTSPLKTAITTRSEVIFLLYLTAGFTAIRLFVLLTHWSGLHFSSAISDAMGIAGNYLTLALLLGLVWLSLKFNVTNDKPAISTEKSDADEAQKLRELKHVIEQFIESEKPFLNSQLSLHRFAQHLGLPERQVSLAINKGFQKNFQEYINDLRVQEAMRLLRSPADHDKTVTEVATLSGFNSKASFNRLFKKYTEQTPTAFRAQI